MPSEMGETFRAWDEYKKNKRANNRDSSPKMLDGAGITYTSKNMGAHLIIEHAGVTVDFWPGTGKFIFRGDVKKPKGRGVRNLIRRLKGFENADTSGSA